MKSINRRLLALLLGALAMAAILIGVSSYLQAHEEIDELFDYQLLQTALSLRYQSGFGQRPPAASEYEKDEGFVIQVWDRSGRPIYDTSHSDDAVPRAGRPGLQDVTGGKAGWRVYLLNHGGRTIQVSQSLAARREMSFSFVLRAIVPLVVIFSALALMIWLIVRYTLSPLKKVAGVVARLSPSSLDPIPEVGLPVEILPLVRRLNTLFEQLDHAFDIQRRFVADAAHELRTPLTAVKLQARVLERCSGDAERAEALEDLKSGVDRAARLVTQLLALARVDPDAAPLPQVEVRLDSMISAVCAEQYRIAAESGIALRMAAVEPTSVIGEPDALRGMISNLVDNAIRYTPSGGTIDVGLHQDGRCVTIAVADTGPGIPPAERERIFDRFSRGSRVDGTGCGLGLAIVRSAVTRHGGTIELGESDEGRGLLVKIELPHRRSG